MYIPAIPNENLLISDSHKNVVTMDYGDHISINARYDEYAAHSVKNWFVEYATIASLIIGSSISSILTIHYYKLRHYKLRPCFIINHFNYRYTKNRIASRYPSKPLPAIVVWQASDVYENRRYASRRLISERCTSTAGIPTAFMASGMAMLVCV